MTHPQQVTQGVRWHRFYTLLKTTNFLQGLNKRKTTAGHGKVHELRESYIESDTPKTQSWRTRRMPLRQLHEAALTECYVGTMNPVLFNDCMDEIWTVFSRWDEDERAVCDLQKQRSEACLFVTDLRGKQMKLISAMKQMPNLIRSEASVEPVGQDTLKVVWFIPLRRKI